MTVNYLVDGVPQPKEPDQPAETFYGIGGTNKLKESDAYIKKREYPNGKTFFYIRFHAGHLFDPWGIFEGKENLARWVKAEEETANMFAQYLRTRNKAHYTHANRRHLDG